MRIERSPRSFRAKLLVSYALLVLAVLFVANGVLNQALSADLLEQIDHRLLAAAHDASRWLEEGLDPARVAEHAAQSAEARVTIIDPEGQVLADTERTRDEVAQMENHSTRPEVVAAQRGEVGTATRLSQTLQVSMRYLAVRMHDGRIVRLAVPLDRIERTVDGMRDRLLLASILAVVFAILAALMMAKVIADPLRAMTRAADRLAQGDFAIDMPLAAQDEFGALSRSLNSLSRQLKARIADLTEEHDRLAAMLAGMVEGVLVVSIDGRVVIANRSAAEILETEGELKGRTIAEAIRHPGAKDAIERAVREGQSATLELESIGLPARSVTLNVRPLSPASGGGAVAVLHDVTQLRKLETIRRDFVSNVSHELQTPISAIQSHAETLLDGALDDAKAARGFVEVIHRNARRIGRLVKDLLKLAQLESRAPDQIVREDIDVKDIVDHVIETIRLRDTAAPMEIASAVQDGLRAVGDPDGLAQILLNLADNALKYGKDGGHLTIGGSRADGHVELYVEDDGPGIESRHLPRIFERFYRIDEGRSREAGGTGLGLAIVKHLAESMGGTVEAKSEIGRGSRFTVKLPAFGPD
jgi:two-component system phosphate regulon sensor histidine kinase PhoR